MTWREPGTEHHAILKVDIDFLWPLPTTGALSIFGIRWLLRLLQGGATSGNTNLQLIEGHSAAAADLNGRDDTRLYESAKRGPRDPQAF